VNRKRGAYLIPFSATKTLCFLNRANKKLYGIRLNNKDSEGAFFKVPFFVSLIVENLDIYVHHMDP
jgi:hypothetical protein